MGVLCGSDCEVLIVFVGGLCGVLCVFDVLICWYV